MRYRGDVTLAEAPDHLLLDAGDPEEVRSALHALDGGAFLPLLHVHLEEALRGSDAATVRYVDSYRSLAQNLLVAAREARPELVVEASDGELSIADAGGRPTRAPVWALVGGAAAAPFSSWTAVFDLGDAVALDLVNRVRALIGRPELPFPDQPPRVTVDDASAERFLRHVRRALERHDEPPLSRLMEVFDLSKTELGGLFGVSRQAIDGWLTSGVPADRQEKVTALLALADLLERKLKAGRVPGVARRPAEAYDGRTMLDLVTADRHTELLELVRDSFEWSRAA